MAGAENVCSKLLSGIKSRYVNSLACARVKWGESECFRIDSGVKQKCIMSPWLINVYMDAVMTEVKMGMGRGEKEVEIVWALVCR